MISAAGICCLADHCHIIPRHMFEPSATPKPPVAAQMRATFARVSLLALVVLLWPQMAVALAADVLQPRSAQMRSVAQRVDAVAQASHFCVAFGTKSPEETVCWTIGSQHPARCAAKNRMLCACWTSALPPPHA